MTADTQAQGDLVKLAEKCGAQHALNENNAVVLVMRPHVLEAFAAALQGRAQEGELSDERDERLTADGAVSDDLCELLREARDNAIASTAEVDISADRRAYRRELAERLNSARLALRSGASALPAEPKAQSNSLRMPDGRCGMCGGDWSVCGCQGMVNRERGAK